MCKASASRHPPYSSLDGLLYDVVVAVFPSCPAVLPCIGREAFLKEVWNWVDEYGDRICDQLRRLGSSVDWGRKVFTMDDNLSVSSRDSWQRVLICLHLSGKE